MAIFDFLSKKIDEADYEAIGIRLSEKVWFKELAFYIAVSYIADTISKCEVKTFEGGKETKGELYYMLNYSPNPNQNGSQFMANLVDRLYYEGEALVVPFTNKWNVYVADGFSVNEKPMKENVFENISIEGETLRGSRKASGIYHFELEQKKVRYLVDRLYEDYGALMASALESYRRGNSDKYALELENVQSGDKAFAEQYRTVIRAQLDAFLNSDKAVYPEFRGQKLRKVETGGAATSADVIALRKEIFETVGQAFKIPMSMMYGNITNMNEVVKNYLSFCVTPVTTMISKELTRKTFAANEFKRGNWIEIDTSRVNHVSILEVADKVDKAIGSGVANIDDMRVQFNMEPLNTDYSKAHFITKNYAPADTALDSLEGGETNAE